VTDYCYQGIEFCFDVVSILYTFRDTKKCYELRKNRYKLALSENIVVEMLWQAIKNSGYSLILTSNSDIHLFYLTLPFAFLVNSLIVSDTFLQAVFY
jgi:hypothetical protein